MSLQPTQARLQSLTAEYQKIQTDLANVVEARQRLDAQRSESELVKKEFAQLTPNNIVFKQIGPVLVKQDHAEAKSNVETRLGFISEELKRLEQQLKDLSSKSEQKKTEIVELQATIQQQAQKAALPSAPLAISPTM